MDLFSGRHKNRNIMIVIAVIIVAIVIIYYYRSSKESYNLEEESTPINDELKKIADEQAHQTHSSHGSPAKRPTLVLFHAGFCGACKSFLPAWEHAKQQLAKDIDVMDFQYETEGDIVKQNNIEGFPTVRLYPDGFPSPNFIQYEGNRTPESLIRFVMSGGRSA